MLHAQRISVGNKDDIFFANKSDNKIRLKSFRSSLIVELFLDLCSYCKKKAQLLTAKNSYVYRTTSIFVRILAGNASTAKNNAFFKIR